MTLPFVESRVDDKDEDRQGPKTDPDQVALG
jgi:hypothetical protein